MAMRKYTKGEGIKVLKGEEILVLAKHMEKTGKRSLAAFDKDELEALQEDLKGLATDGE